MDILLSPEPWILAFSAAGLSALIALTAMEIVLGIDNIVVLSIVTGKLPVQQQPRARSIGLAGALLMRLLLLLSLTWIQSFTTPMFTLFDHGFTARDLILLGGGLFLIFKSVKEIYAKVEGAGGEKQVKQRLSMVSAIAQVIALDLVFSLDSVITAVGMSNNLPVMVMAVLIAIAVMWSSAGMISSFVHGHPAVKLLALAFLSLIGLVLVSESIGMHVDKGYVYSAMGFSFVVIMLLVRMNGKEGRSGN
jgi:predicted tellurium resistance membrane protein TerC